MKNKSIKEQKTVLRKTMREQRDEMSPKERDALSQEICSKLWSFILENDFKFIHSYLTMRSEVDVLPLLKKALDYDLTVVAPKTLKKRKMQNLVLTDLSKMEEGIFNTYYPKDATTYTGHYDLILIAGLAFDQAGHRLGYGGGYYDTFLAEHPNAKKVGVCYPFQIIENIPVEEHDIKLDLVIN